LQIYEGKNAIVLSVMSFSALKLLRWEPLWSPFTL